jgi:predicted Zn-dependent protease
MSQAVDASRIQELADTVAFALAEARAAGAGQAEADVSLQQGLGVSVRLGEVETIEYQRDRGLGITVYVNGSKGSASSADLRPEAVRDMVAKACSPIVSGRPALGTWQGIYLVEHRAAPHDRRLLVHVLGE